MNDKIFFKGLNELRAIAALCVVWHHIELYCYREKNPSLFYPGVFKNFINSLGKDGVYLFVISERKWNLRSTYLSFLGTISYGIYMYHPLLLFVSSAMANNFLTHAAAYKVLLYVLTISTTILVSYISYECIEKKLIRIKNKKYNS